MGLLSLALLKNGNNTFSEGPPFPKNRPLAFFRLIFSALSFFQEAHIGARNVTMWYFFVDLKYERGPLLFLPVMGSQMH